MTIATLQTSSCNPGIGTLKTFACSQSGKAEFDIGLSMNINIPINPLCGLVHPDLKVIGFLWVAFN